MGVTFTYIYQLTFFTSVMAYAGEWEYQNLHVLTFKPAISIEKAGTQKLKISLSLLQ